MSDIIALFVVHALLAWLAVGAVFLVVEIITGSGWLLWPAGSAAAVAVVAAVTRIGPVGAVAIFALLTIVTTYLGRRFINQDARHGHDPNDPHARLIGRAGKAAIAFQDGLGRVFVDGKEWAAELDGAGPVASGARIEVIALIGGARLKVRAG